MNAYLVSYTRNEIDEIDEIEVGDGYDWSLGAYAEQNQNEIHRTVGSNQLVVPEDHPMWEKCVIWLYIHIFDVPYNPFANNY